MIIRYNPVGDVEKFLGMDVRAEFDAEYMAKMGRPRMRLEIAQHSLVLMVNSAGALSLVPRLLEIAAGTMDHSEFKHLEEFEPGGGWWGDIEPDSPGARVERIGPPLPLPYSFSEEIGSRRRDVWSNLALEFDVFWTRDPRTEEGQGAILGTADGLVALARLGAQMSAPHLPEGAQVQCARRGTPPIVLRKSDFSESVPWAVAPGRDHSAPQRSDRQK